ncbi:MAG TPA: hypothetical protein VJ044_09785, partial [Candidatus Hodarchaeales archaeon]|nr:hypothetical protein [Candidatus Hodarchaeales archaeon]
FTNLAKIPFATLQIEILLTLLGAYIQGSDENRPLQILAEAEKRLENLEGLSLDIQEYFEGSLALLLGLFYFRMSHDFRLALEYFSASSSQFQRGKQNLGLIEAKYWIGICTYRLHDLENSIMIHNESLDLARYCGNDYWIGHNLLALGKVHAEQESWQKSTVCYTQSINIFRDLKLEKLVSSTLLSNISCLFQLKEWSTLETQLLERLDLAKSTEDTADIISSNYWLAYYYEYRGNYENALATYQSTLEFLNLVQYLDEIHRCSAHISYLTAQMQGTNTRGNWQGELTNVSKPWRIVFVCNGNVSRSPYVEFLAKDWIRTHVPQLKDTILVESLGVLYRNRDIHPQTREYLAREGIQEDLVKAHLPRHWEDYPESCSEATIFVAMTGEQTNFLNFHYPGKVFMLSYVAEEIFESVLDPAVHRSDARELFIKMKNWTIKFMEKVSMVLEE